MKYKNLSLKTRNHYKALSKRLYIQKLLVGKPEGKISLGPRYGRGYTVAQLVEALRYEPW
jgi:hypothetical protein